MNVRPIPPGEDRCPGRARETSSSADGWNVPQALIAESYEYLGDRDIDFARYTSPAFFDAEVKKLWPKVWQWACREEHIPRRRRLYVYDVGPYSVSCVRTAERDQGLSQCLPAPRYAASPIRHTGFARELRCPFHGWSWSLDGKLKELPCRWDFPHVKDEGFQLPEVKVERWGGFVFINMDPDAGPLADHPRRAARSLQGRLGPVATATRCCTSRRNCDTNWKAAQEAFLEAYHVFATHTQGLPTAGDANAQYDIFGETREPVRPHHRPSQPALHAAADPAGDPRQDAARRTGAWRCPKAAARARSPPSIMRETLAARHGAWTCQAIPTARCWIRSSTTCSPTCSCFPASPCR